MNWKTEIQLNDLDNNQKLELTCILCGHSHYEKPDSLKQQGGMDFLYLDEVEKHLCCTRPYCKGRVKLAILYTQDTEGFVGGLS